MRAEGPERGARTAPVPLTGLTEALGFGGRHERWMLRRLMMRFTCVGLGYSPSMAEVSGRMPTTPRLAVLIKLGFPNPRRRAPSRGPATRIRHALSLATIDNSHAGEEGIQTSLISQRMNAPFFSAPCSSPVPCLATLVRQEPAACLNALSSARISTSDVSAATDTLYIDNGLPKQQFLYHERRCWPCVSTTAMHYYRQQ